MFYARSFFYCHSEFRLKICFLILFISVTIGLFAQPFANFSASSVTGCSPLSVSFTNTTTGASSNAKYQWDFGNGNSSTNKNAAAIYSTEQTFVVTLSVTDNNVTSIKSMNITVFKNPSPSFTVNSASGCTPLNVTFTSTSSLGSGTTGFYYWDFGDGTTLDFDSTQQTVSHSYTSGQYSVRFEVKTNTGCLPVLLTQNSFIKVLSKPISAYTRSKAYLCSAGDAITFTNISSAAAGASYLWKFGDGTSSTEVSPTHIYSTIGTFNDSLIVTNANGCSDTSFSPTPVYSASFITDFVIPKSGLCAGSNINFTNISKPIPDVANWYFSGQAAAVSGINVSKVFAKEGNYTIKLVNLYGTCLDSISKSITILPSLSIAGFTVSSLSLCGGKTSVKLTDTTHSTTTLWNLEGASDTLTTNPASFTFSQDSIYNISLFVTNSGGCTASIMQPVFVTHIPVTITSTSNNPQSNSSGCPGLKVNFLPTPSSNIKTYSWNFGDSIRTSTDPSPTHTYDSIGIFPVELIYTTLDGCTDSTFLRNVITFSKPVPAFISANTDQCGGGVQFFDLTPKPVTNWFWYFGDSTSSGGNAYNSVNTNQNPKHFFYDSGYYDIKLVATNGTCSDSITNFKYQHIKAPIAHIDSVSFTCSGDRNTVLIWSSYKYVVNGTWDFGDKSTPIPVDTSIHPVSHHYPTTGVYETVLTTTNGACIPKDTLWIPILSKQNPKLNASVTSICANDTLSVFIDTSTLAKNPVATDSNYYNIYQWQYGDASVFTTGLSQPYNWYYSNLGTLTGLIPGKTNIRVITQSENYGCLDTSNYINLTVKGPVAGYSVKTPKECFKQPLSFTDSSKKNFGVPIVKWEWDFGDNTYDTLTLVSNGNTTHIYAKPKGYATSLKVIDNDGCYNISQQGDSALPSGPKANFRWSPSYIITGTTATFTNTTNTFEDNQVNYFWTFFSDGTKSSSRNTSHAYNASGTDSIQLIALNPQNGCRDTVAYNISIKKVFALFTIKTKYAKKTCPPMQAVFTSHSVNSDMLSWDFGDGSNKSISADTFASHTYYEPGVYKVTLYAYKNSFLLDSSSQIITVKGAYATVTSNLTQGCIGSAITIKSTQVNTASFTWDFGDGVVIPNSPDSTITHQYVFAGVFTPHILMTDINGCSSSFPAQQPIIIDSLHTSFSISKTPVCDTGTVIFTPAIISFSADSLRQPLTYHWDFGTGIIKDTSNKLTPLFDYKTIGSYPVSQTVTSVYGCVTNVVGTVFVKPSSHGIITAPATVCEAKPVTFTATPSFPGNVQWHWYFNNGDTSNLQNPLSESFPSAMDSVSKDTIMLVTMLNNCYDTSYFHLTVNPFPRVNLQPKVKRICEGDTAHLAAFDGNQFSWTPAEPNIATPIIKPLKTTPYSVVVTNRFGCSNIDSTTINVTPDIRQLLVYTKDTFVCKGLGVQLPVSGADSFVWLKDSATLTNYGNNSTNPTATPVVSPTVYQFVASDKYGCVHDTAYISVIQVPFPTIRTRDTLTMPTGTSSTLNATVSPDVITYHWSPADYLDNPNYSSPICTPRKDVVYTVKVTNEYGCSVSDSISVHLICAQSLFAPSAFIPSSNYENNNQFYPKGQGLKEVIFFRVYNRVGELIFENTHFQPSIPSTGWDGFFKGQKAPTGTYVYTMQAQCDTGEIFEKKGTIVLIR